MRGLKNAVFRLQSKITSLRKALTILIDDDEAMALMNLSKFRSNPDLYRWVEEMKMRKEKKWKSQEERYEDESKSRDFENYIGYLEKAKLSTCIE